MSRTAYDPARNAAGCYAVAVRALRLAGIRAGQIAPRPSDAEEMEAARHVQA